VVFLKPVQEWTGTTRLVGIATLSKKSKVVPVITCELLARHRHRITFQSEWKPPKEMHTVYTVSLRGYSSIFRNSTLILRSKNQ
jgi:hypothetical protein